MVKNMDARILRILIAACCTIAVATSCRREDLVLKEQRVPIVGYEVPLQNVKGFYLLNEGNMGNNKATLDYFDYTFYDSTAQRYGIYIRNIYADRNPMKPRELGDVGNDIDIYGSKLYAVINCSNFVEVMRAADATHVAEIPIPNCRYLAFHGGYMYVTSYAGPVMLHNPAQRLGYVAKIDTATFAIVDTCTVGYQPDDMAIVGDKLYVANSGGYMFPAYDSTVSVIDLATFQEVKKINVAINLHRLIADKRGFIYVSSRGDYYNAPSRTFIIDSHIDKVVMELTQADPTSGEQKSVRNSEMSLCGDSIYFYGVEFSYITNSNSISYGIIDCQSQQVVSRHFITDGTEKDITIPYGVAVNPETREIFVTDAKDYISPGKLHCYSPDGQLQWSVTTGDIPAHFVFVYHEH